jgi:hypothetical protein
MPVQALRRPGVLGGRIDHGVRQAEPGTDHSQEQDQQVGRFQIGGDDSTLLCPGDGLDLLAELCDLGVGGSVRSR